jgi:hypothetical protein
MPVVTVHRVGSKKQGRFQTNEASFRVASFRVGGRGQGKRSAGEEASAGCGEGLDPENLGRSRVSC